MPYSYADWAAEDEEEEESFSYQNWSADSSAYNYSDWGQETPEELHPERIDPNRGVQNRFSPVYPKTGHITGHLSGIGVGAGDIAKMAAKGLTFAGKHGLGSMYTPNVDAGLRKAEKLIDDKILKPSKKLRENYLASATTGKQYKFSLGGEEHSASFSEMFRMTNTLVGEIWPLGFASKGIKLVGAGRGTIDDMIKLGTNAGRAKRAGIKASDYVDTVSASGPRALLGRAKPGDWVKSGDYLNHKSGKARIRSSPERAGKEFPHELEIGDNPNGPFEWLPEDGFKSLDDAMATVDDAGSVLDDIRDPAEVEEAAAQLVDGLESEEAFRTRLYSDESFMKWHTQAPEPKSAREYLQYAKTSFIKNWADWDHPLSKLHPNIAEAFAFLRGGSGTINAGIDFPASVIKESGEWKHVGTSLHDIISGKSKTYLRDIDTIVALERQVFDIAPRNVGTVAELKKLQAKIDRTTNKKVLKELKKQHDKLSRQVISFKGGETVLPGHDIVKQNQLDLDRLYLIHRKTRGQLDADIAAYRQWSIDARLIPLQEIGVISAKELAKITDKGPHYAMYHRVLQEEENFLRKVGGEEAVGDLQEALARQLQETGGVKLGGDAGRKPLGPLTRGLQAENPILSPLQSEIMTIQKLNYWVDRQRVRNRIGEALEEGYGGVLGKDFFKVEDTYTMNSVMGNRKYSTFLHWKDGKKTMYVHKDKLFNEAMNRLNGHQASYLKGVLGAGFNTANWFTKTFRAGVILGHEFIIRNPARDQFIAGVMSKFGYNPFTSGVRGLLHVLAKSPTWRMFHRMRAGTGELISQDMPKHLSTIDDAAQIHTVSQRANQIFEAAGMDVQRKTAGVVRKAGMMIRHGAFHPRHVKQTVVQTLRNSGLSGTGTAEAIYKNMSPGARVWAGTKNFAHAPINALRNAAQVFEEASRVGNTAKALARMRKGKGYTFLPAFDAAFGGLPGMWNVFKQMAKGDLDPFRKGFKDIGKWRRSVTNDGYVDWADVMKDTRELALDYRRSGSKGEVMNAFYVFANAELQDTSRVLRALKESPLNTMTKAMAFMTVPAMANWYRNFDDPRYRSMSDTERELFYHPFGFSEKYGKFARFPKPIGILQFMFGSTMEKAMDHIAFENPEAIVALEAMLWGGDGGLRGARNDLMERMAKYKAWNDPLVAERNKTGGDPDALAALKKSFSGIGPMRFMPEFMGGQGEITRPTALGGIQGIRENRDPFFDSPVTPRRFTDQNAINPEHIKTATTSPIDEAIAAAIRKYTFAKDINPIQARFLATKTFGSLGQHTIRNMDQVLREFGVFDERPGIPRDITNEFPSGAFWGRPVYGSGSDPVEDFYRMKTDVDMAHKTYLDRATSNDLPGATEVMDNQPEMAAYSYFGAISREMADINQAYRYIRQDPSITDEIRAAKLMDLDKIKTQLAFYATEWYREVFGDKEEEPEEGTP